MPLETSSTPPPPAAAVVPPPAVPAHPQTVTIPLEQLQAFTAIQARLAQVESDNRQREQQARDAQAAVLLQKGEVENALGLLRQQSEQQLTTERATRAAVEERAKRYALSGEVSRVLASQALVPGAAEQLTRLWESEFKVEAQGDSFAVRTPTFQSVGEFVAAQLARPEYAHFVQAQNPRGGTGGVSPATQTAPMEVAQTAVPEQPATLSEAVILHMKEVMKPGPDGRTHMGSAMGLRGLPRR